MKSKKIKIFCAFIRRLQNVGLREVKKKILLRILKLIKKITYLTITINKEPTLLVEQGINRVSYVNSNFFDCNLSDVSPDILKAADEILNNRYYVHDFGKVECELKSVQWEDWPVDLVRSFHRHDFYITLARAFRQTNKSRYKKAIKRLVKELPQYSPIETVKKYDKSIDIAIRILNWTAICPLINKNNWEPGELTYWFHQVEWIIVNLSPGGNHRLLEGLGLFAAALYFSEIKQAAKWLEIGKRIVLYEMNCQVSTEGIHLEQSMYYHQICSTHFLKFYMLCHRSNIALSKEFTRRFKKMLKYIWFSQKPDGSHPMIGDGDQMLSNDREHWEARSLIPVYGYLYKTAVSFDENYLESANWFLDTKSYKQLRLDEFSDKRHSVVFKHSGHAILKSDSGNYLYFNCGPIGYKPYPHHGHSDALSVEICINNKAIVIDPGGYGYYNDHYREYLRSTFGHNTVLIDRKNQSEIYGVFGYGKLAKVWLKNFQFSSDFDFVEGYHNGYSPVIHKRQIFYNKKPSHYILIADFITGNGNHLLEIPFHLSPECDVQNKEKYLSLFKNKFFLHNFASSQTSFEVIDKKEKKNNYMGVVSLQHSKLTPSQIIIYKTHTLLPFYSLSLFSPVNSIKKVSFFREEDRLLINSQLNIDEYIVNLSNKNIIRKGHHGNIDF